MDMGVQTKIIINVLIQKSKKAYFLEYIIYQDQVTYNLSATIETLKWSSCKLDIHNKSKEEEQETNWSRAIELLALSISTDRPLGPFKFQFFSLKIFSTLWLKNFGSVRFILSLLWLRSGIPV